MKSLRRANPRIACNGIIVAAVQEVRPLINVGGNGFREHHKTVPDAGYGMRDAGSFRGDDSPSRSQYSLQLFILYLVSRISHHDEIHQIIGVRQIRLAPAHHGHLAAKSKFIELFVKLIGAPCIPLEHVNERVGGAQLRQVVGVRTSHVGDNPAACSGLRQHPLDRKSLAQLGANGSRSPRVQGATNDGQQPNRTGFEHHLLTPFSASLRGKTFEQEQAEPTEWDRQSLLTHSWLAPGRINLDTPSVNFRAWKLMINPNGISNSFM